jgi:hypothetical protein
MNANKTPAEVCKAFGLGADAHPKAIELEPGVCAMYGLGKHPINGRARTYFVDADTGEELRFSGSQSLGMGANGSHKGVQYSDTSVQVYVRRADGVAIAVTAEAFPGHRVLVKDWSPNGGVEWRALVATARGWQRKCSDTRKELGADRMGWSVSRSAA